MYRLLFACVAGASSFQLQGQVQDSARVLLFGSSVDRNAIVAYCGDNLEKVEYLESRWCNDAALNTRMGFMFHPGVGYNGDLHRPFHTSYYKQGKKAGHLSTGAILKGPAKNTSLGMLEGAPDLVVVDSSLWDLAVWRQHDQVQVSGERVRKWCQHDLPGLLGAVAETFPTSRIAFRTAPTIGTLAADGKAGLEKFNADEIESLYDCITSSTTDGRLFGKYEVVDYHAIMKALLDRGMTGLFMGDGYHPSSYPAALYINEVLRLVGASPQDPPQPSGEEAPNLSRGFPAQDQWGPF